MTPPLTILFRKQSNERSGVTRDPSKGVKGFLCAELRLKLHHSKAQGLEPPKHLKSAPFTASLARGRRLVGSMSRANRMKGRRDICPAYFFASSPQIVRTVQMMELLKVTSRPAVGFSYTALGLKGQLSCTLTANLVTEGLLWRRRHMAEPGEIMSLGKRYKYAKLCANRNLKEL